MGFLQRMTIKTRLTLAFALLVALFVVFGVFSILEMNKLGELTWTLYDHPLRVSNRALKASRGVIKMHGSMKDVSLSKSDLELNEAIQAAKKSRLGLILMDVQFPVLSGFDATKPIKADPSLTDIPVIALTARAMRGEREKILATGFDDYLSKPIDPSDLKTMIKKCTT